MEVLELADELKRLRRAHEEHHLLPGRTLGMIFQKPSTRTRASFVAATPTGYEPAEEAIAVARASGATIEVTHDPASAAVGADVLYTDVWTSMGQDAEREQRLRDLRGFGIDAGVVARASENVIVLHCLPAHYGEEITEDV